MSAPGPRGCNIEGGHSAERGKDPGENNVIHSPGSGPIEQRYGDEQNKLVSCFWRPCSLSV
jgi:hypothetical protein